MFGITSTVIPVWIVIVLSLLGIIFVIAFLRKLFRASGRKESKTLESIRKDIVEGHDGLLRASQSFHRFNDLINEVRKSRNANR